MIALEYSTAADFMSRALFAYERAFSNAFNLTTGIHRLDFDYVENRVFFLALSRNVMYISSHPFRFPFSDLTDDVQRS